MLEAGADSLVFDFGGGGHRLWSVRWLVLVSFSTNALRGWWSISVGTSGFSFWSGSLVMTPSASLPSTNDGGTARLLLERRWL